MTVEEQLLVNTLSKECERLHKVIERIKADIKHEAELSNQMPSSVMEIGLRRALKIIDNHTMKGENKK